MAERHAYMRDAKSLPPLDRQRQSLQAAGLTELNPARDRAYLDVPPRRRSADVVLEERARAIHACRAGDELWIAFPSVLGVSVDDALSVLDQITRRGAVLRVASTGGRYRFHPEAAEALAFAREIGEEARQNRTSKAREAAVARQVRTRAAERRAWDRAREMWGDLRFTVKQITAETGIKARTLYNAVERGDFPPRNAQPFTGGPSAKRRGKG
jgi:hypothetical protein